MTLLLFNTQNEVARAIELREIVTSLGPAYIKLGQALSIRPDILSPSAMTELQKLCDKVHIYQVEMELESDYLHSSKKSFNPTQKSFDRYMLNGSIRVLLFFLLCITT